MRAAHTTEGEADSPLRRPQVGVGQPQTPELEPNAAAGLKHQETPRAGWSHGFSSDLPRELPTQLTQCAGSFYVIISRSAHKPFSLRLMGLWGGGQVEKDKNVLP